jgi:VRR-NUC domain.
VANWTEEDYAALMARRATNDICAALGRRYGQKGRQEASLSKKRTGKKAKEALPTPSEHEEQVRLFEVCKLHEKKYPGLELIHAIPNGGERHAAVAAKLKAEGVKAGVPDIFLPVPKGNAHGLYIELKAIGGSVTDKQRAMMAGLSRQGYACLVCYGWENAWREIEAYMKTESVHLGVLL